MNQTLQAGALYLLKMLDDRSDSPPTYRQPSAVDQYIGTTVTFSANLGNVIWIDGKAFTQSNEAGKGTHTLF